MIDKLHEEIDYAKIASAFLVVHDVACDMGMDGLKGLLEFIDESKDAQLYNAIYDIYKTSVAYMLEGYEYACKDEGKVVSSE